MLMRVQLLGLLYAILSAGYQSKTSPAQLGPGLSGADPWKAESC